MSTFPSYIRKQANEGGIYIHTYGVIRPGDELAMRRVLDRQSIVVIVALHKSFEDYKGGIYYGPKEPFDYFGEDVRLHDLEVVGYGSTDDCEHYLIGKNSYGTKCGEEGYIRIHMNGTKVGVLGINIQPIYPIPS